MTLLLAEISQTVPPPEDVNITLRPDWTYRVTRRKTDLVKRLDITVSKSTTVRINGTQVS